MATADRGIAVRVFRTCVHVPQSEDVSFCLIFYAAYVASNGCFVAVAVLYLSFTCF